MLYSMFIFLLSALFEVGGGYLVWIWLKNDKSVYIGILGFILLGLYGVVATLQTQNFGRVYAAYGGIFIIFSIFWAYFIDDFKPDIYDILGGIITLLGVCIIMFAKR